MLQIEFIANSPNNQLELAKHYIARYISKSEIMMDNFLQIMAVIQNRFDCKDDKLINKDGSQFREPYEISLKDALGCIKRAEIIKKLNKHEHSYEIRIDNAYEHVRIVFFVNDLIIRCVFTFGFTKTKSDINSDKTDFCAFYTDCIALDFKMGNSNRWLPGNSEGGG